jgi:hypothetical protein
MIDPVVVGLVSAVTALVASIVGPLVTLHIGRSQIRASVLAVNRQKWIESFREAVSAFCSQVAAVVHSRERFIHEGRLHLGSDPEILHRFEALILVFTKIRLLTDPTEEQHQQLLAVMQALLRTLEKASPGADIQAEVEASVGKIVELCLNVLRKEWARVQRLD